MASKSEKYKAAKKAEGDFRWKEKKALMHPQGSEEHSKAITEREEARKTRTEAYKALHEDD